MFLILCSLPSGAFLCSAHRICNLKTRLYYRVSLIAHNSQKFDQILMNKTFSNPDFQKKKVVNTSTINMIPKSYEHYLTESFRFFCEFCSPEEGQNSSSEDGEEGIKKNAYGCVHYPIMKTIDSLNHLQASLSNLADELKQSSFTISDLRTNFSTLFDWIKQRWDDKTEAEYDELLSLLTQKQFFPYSYITSPSKLEEKELPPLEKWRENFLNTKVVTQEEVDYANNVFRLFGCQSISEFYNLYLVTGILILTSVMEAWRKLGKEKFTLDPINFVSLPSYGFAVWLYNSGVKIELLQDYEQILLFEGAKRGEWSGVAGLRFGKANHKGIPMFYKPDEPTHYLVDADLVGLYAFCMTFCFPHNTFRDMSQETLDAVYQYFQDTKGIDIKTNSDFGFHLVCDLSIDPECEDLLEIFPPLVQNKSTDDESIISPLMTKLKKEFKIKNEGDRLIADLTDKKDYVLSAYALKCYMRCGVKLNSIKRGVCYRQSPFLKKQMESNQELRKHYQSQNMTANSNSIKRMSNSSKYSYNRLNDEGMK